MDLSKNGYYSPSRGSLTIGKMLDEIGNFVKDDPKSFYSLVIGTDSQIKHTNGHSECDFVTAIVVHRKGRGARYFWKKDKVKKAPVLREKIYTETTKRRVTEYLKGKAGITSDAGIRNALINIIFLQPDVQRLNLANAGTFQAPKHETPH